MRIGWYEVLGLLVGVAICYGVISYALLYSSENRESASEQTQESSQRGQTAEQTSSEGSDEDTKTVVVRVTGARGEPFGANYGNLLSGRSVEGSVPEDYRVQVRTDPLSGDYVFATAWKTTGSSRELKVQILDGGTVVREGSTTEDYGAASVRWNPNEPPPAESTVPATQKTKEKVNKKVSKDKSSQF